MNILHEIDNMEFMKDKPDKHFDLSITDPPYNVGIKYGVYNDGDKDYYNWCDSWFNELLRVSETVVLTVGYKNIKYWINKDPKGIIYWIKPNQNSPSQLGGFNCIEHIFYFGKLQKRVGQDYFIKSIGMQRDASFHPVPKYLPAWKKLITLVAKRGNTLFDPFSGSGTTRIAAHDLGFDLTSCELDPDYCRDNEARYQKHIQQNELFSTEEIQEKIYKQGELWN